MNSTAALLWKLIICGVGCVYLASAQDGGWSTRSVRKIDQVHFFGREEHLQQVYSNKEQHASKPLSSFGKVLLRSTSTSILEGKDSLLESAEDGGVIVDGDDDKAKRDEEDEEDESPTSPAPSHPAPKPKPKPLPIKRKPSPSSPNIPQTYYEGKLYTSDVIPYQRFGHQLLALEDSVVVSSASTTNPLSNKIYIFSIDKVTSTDGNTTVTSSEYALSQTLTSTRLASSSSSLPSSGQSFDGYGHILTSSFNGQYLFISAPYDESLGYFAGKVYLYHANEDNEKYQWKKYFSPSSQYALGSLYGASMASQGKLVVIGAPGESYFNVHEIVEGENEKSASSSNVFVGAVYCYQFNDATDEYEESQILVNTHGESYDRFGSSVTLISSTDEITQTMIVGTVGYSRNQYHTRNAGAVYIYQQDLTLQTWALQQLLSPSSLSENAYFGHSIAATEEYLAVAAYRSSEDGASSSSEPNANGVVYLYRFASATNQWMLQEMMYPTDSNANPLNMFGSALLFYQYINQETISKTSKFFHNNDEGENQLDVIAARALQQNASNTEPVGDLQSTFVTVESSIVTMLIIGAPGDSSIAAQSGAVYVYSSDASISTSTRHYVTNEGEEVMFTSTSSSSSSTANSKAFKRVAKFTSDDSQEGSAYGNSLSTASSKFVINGAVLNNATSLSAASLIYVGSEYGNSPLQNLTGVIYVEHELLSYYYNVSKSMSNDDNSSTKWLTALYYFLFTSGGIIGVAFVPALLFMACVVNHVQQRDAKLVKGQDEVPPTSPSSLITATDQVKTSPSRTVELLDYASKWVSQWMSMTSTKSNYETLRNGEQDIELASSTKTEATDGVQSMKSPLRNRSFANIYPTWTQNSEVANPLANGSSKRLSGSQGESPSTSVAVSDLRITTDVEESQDVLSRLSIRSPITFFPSMQSKLVPSPMQKNNDTSSLKSFRLVSNSDTQVNEVDHGSETTADTAGFTPSEEGEQHHATSKNANGSTLSKMKKFFHLKAQKNHVRFDSTPTILASPTKEQLPANRSNSTAPFHHSDDSFTLQI